MFRTCPYRLWGPPSLLYNGYQFSFLGVKQPGCGIDYPPPSSAKVKERVELHSTPPLGLCGLFQGELLIYTVSKLIEICLF